MKLYQYIVGGARAVVAEERGERFVLAGAATTLELLTRAGASAETLVNVARRAKKRPLPAEGVEGPLIPVEPPEVWGFGVTYETSATERGEDAGRTSGLAAREAGDIYARAHIGPRPETFFKATAARCVGPGEDIGIRGDSKLTAAEPELAYVVGVGNAVVAYTLGNDVSAWDLERENPLYLPQSKIYTACCALGPCLITADAIDPANVELAMTIKRGGEVVFEGRANTSQLRYPIAYFHEFLTRYNPLPPASAVLTGTGVMTPAGFALQEGDEVTIEAEPFGRLVNRARRL
ncbi:MAG: 2-keto-3-deoxy-D-arabinonate dehydratase [candidate division Zixibacteria bacterium]|nr:2-keto-3-deoxy-D-arabinonate dehydratase [candidate division Zixibacteria bacterium]